jgi:predicted metalloprotease with PDZ domain
VVRPLGSPVYNAQVHARSAFFVLFLLVVPASVLAQAPVTYRVSFPAPQHHYAEVEAVFADLPSGPLELRMSRSSPGRYALHEFAKNVFDVHTYDGSGKELPFVRPNPYQWNVPQHPGRVRVVYKIFGNRVDGTYLGIDASHAHMNMPATLMWARGLDARAVRVTFAPPSGSAWKPATQLFPTDDPWTFTAPNLQYLMDSPTELSNQSFRSFKVRNPDGREQTIVTAVHHDATDAEVDEYVAGTEKIVREQAAVYGELPQFDNGTYTFLGDYVPWGGGDGMEHRNSTVVAEGASIRGNVRGVLGTVSHEFFHAWNVERIRPQTIEPFNFEEANMSGELWLAEGFTQYYGQLIMARTGLSAADRTMLSLANNALAIASSPAHRFRSAVEMSQLAPFTDAASSIDSTNYAYSFISYYPYGSALALALDLSLRERTAGRLTLDDYMRALWRVHGKPAAAPGYVAKPYTLADARARLAELTDDRAFAEQFFSRYIEGREVPDYRALLKQAGVVVRKRNPGEAWTGVSIDASGKVVAARGLVDWGTPAFDAGLEHNDVLTSLDGKPFAAAALKNRKPGDKVAFEVRHVGGVTASGVLTFGEDPTEFAVAAEAAGNSLRPEQKAFRDAWLGSRQRPSESRPGR